MSNQTPTPTTAPVAARFRIMDKVVATEQADATILLDLRNGRYYTLNPVGGRIWSLISSGASMDQVLARVKEEFDAPDEQLTNDVEEFVASLLSGKLIRRDD